jgi:hypothetical protein
MKLTPLEQIEHNRAKRNKQLTLAIKLSNLLKELDECKKFLDGADQFRDDPYLSEMYAPELVKTVEADLVYLESAVSMITKYWAELEGHEA